MIKSLSKKVINLSILSASIASGNAQAMQCNQLFESGLKAQNLSLQYNVSLNSELKLARKNILVNDDGTALYTYQASGAVTPLKSVKLTAPFRIKEILPLAEGEIAVTTIADAGNGIFGNHLRKDTNSVVMILTIGADGTISPKDKFELPSAGTVSNFIKRGDNEIILNFDAEGDLNGSTILLTYRRADLNSPFKQVKSSSLALRSAIDIEGAKGTDKYIFSTQWNNQLGTVESIHRLTDKGPQKIYTAGSSKVEGDRENHQLFQATTGNVFIETAQGRYGATDFKVLKIDADGNKVTSLGEIPFNPPALTDMARSYGISLGPKTFAFVDNASFNVGVSSVVNANYKIRIFNVESGLKEQQIINVDDPKRFPPSSLPVRKADLTLHDLNNNEFIAASQGRISIGRKIGSKFSFVEDIKFATKIPVSRFQFVRLSEDRFILVEMYVFERATTVKQSEVHLFERKGNEFQLTGSVQLKGRRIGAPLIVDEGTVAVQISETTNSAQATASESGVLQVLTVDSMRGQRLSK